MSGAERADTGAGISWSVSLGWASGSLGIAILFNTTNYLLLRFLVDHLAIAAALASAVLAAAKVYDACVNPLVGVASDRLHSAAGRRRPFLLVASVLCALALPLLFSPPAALEGMALLAYVGFAILFYATAYTLFNVPYLAMPAEMTTVAAGRSRLMSLRVAAIGAGQLLAGALVPLLIVRFGGDAQAHARAAWVLAPLVLLACGVAWASTKSAPFTREDPAARSDLAAYLDVLRNNRPFLFLLLAKLLILGGFAVQQATLAIFTRHALAASDVVLGQFVAANSVGIVASMFLWHRVIPVLGKTWTFGAGAALFAVVSLAFCLAGPGTAAGWVMLGGALIGLGSGAVLLVGQLLLPEAIDHDRRRTGVAREGLYAGVYSTVERIAFAAGLALAGLLLGAVGYVAGSARSGVVQPAEAIRGLYACTWLLPSAFMLLSVLAIRQFNRSQSVEDPACSTALSRS